MSTGNSGERAAGGASGEVVGLALLCVALLAIWALEYQPFALPNNDWYSFERTAQSFAAGELPASYKRMPLFPALVALLAPAMPDPHPWLHAALLWNLAFSIATLVALFALGRLTFGRGALVAPVLLAASAQFHVMALQPLVEPSLTFFVVLSFLGLRRGASWQWWAAFAAGLSRYEAAAVIPVLFAVNLWREGRPGRQLLRAGLASSGVLAWVGLGALQGAGGGQAYFALMSGMGFQPALGFVWRSLEEPFRGWYGRPPLLMAAFAVVVTLPLGAGLVHGFRRFRQDTLALVAFWGLCVGAIVLFGISKARYVSHGQWIPLFFWAGGAPRLVAAWLPRLRPVARVAPAIAALCVGLAVAALALFAWRAAPLPQVTPLAADELLVVLGLGLGLAAWAPLLPAAPRGIRAAGLAAFALLLAPLLAGGLAHKEHTLVKVRFANQSSWTLARWLETHLAPGERIVLMPRSHILFLTRIPDEQLLTFDQFELQGPRELAAEMRRRGVTYVAYTHRGDPDDPAEHHYYRIKHTALAELFMKGDPVPGFRHVATLPPPEGVDERPVQVYRLLPEDDPGG